MDETEEEEAARNRSQHELSEARALVLAAFEQARAKGKRDWRTMTVAVLKNRILQIAGRDFDPRDYGASGMSDLVRRLSDTVDLDPSTSPPSVHLIGESEVPLTTDAVTEPISIATPHARVRRDLFSAVLDYSSSSGYVWDVDAKIAMPAVHATGIGLPTVTFDELRGWREAFAERFVPASESADAAALQIWAERSLPTHFLPKHVQGEWNGELKRRVLQRLEQWFAVNNLAPPSDLVIQHRATPPPADLAEVEQLRALVVTVVSTMTPQELRSLTLPAGAILKARFVRSDDL